MARLSSDRQANGGGGAYLLYGLMIGATALIYEYIRSIGETLPAPVAQVTSTFGAQASRSQGDSLLHVLLALVIVIALARGLGNVFRLFHQPPVVGEIIAGIVLGPSVLGRLGHGLAGYILPPEVAPFLNVISQVGIILYMFLVGLELDPAILRQRGHATVAISHASIIAPFTLGALLALFLYPRLSTSDVPFNCFALFLGVSMSVTAFPVLARILTDRRIHKTRMGAIALTCAAVDDITAWCLLAFVVGVVQARSGGAIATFAMAIAYIALMILIVRPAMGRLSRFYGNRGRLTQGVLASMFVMLLLSALATELIGIHAIFGAFALGAVVPHDSGMARELTDRLEDVIIVLLLPAFFAFTGMHTQIGLLDSPTQWGICALIILVASAGKFGGSFLAARLTGLGWNDSSALGVLMNTRGLMELIVLNIGLQLKVISPALFAMLVLMALVTTFATTPILHLITRGRNLAEEDETAKAPIAPRPALVHPERASERRAILVPISNPEGVATLVDLALAATRHGDPPPHILSFARPPSGGVRSGLREAEQRVTAHTPALEVALDYARACGATIMPQAQWNADPAGEILRTARKERVGWLLLGSHRPVFGADFKGGVVGAILDHIGELQIHVGVVLHSGESPFDSSAERPLDRVVAVVDNTPHGRASLDLATRIAQQRNCALHAVIVPKEGTEPEPDLAAQLREISRTAGRWLNSDVLTERTAAQLALKTPGRLVVLGTNLVDELGLPAYEISEGARCVVVTRGTSFTQASGLSSAADPAAAVSATS